MCSDEGVSEQMMIRPIDQTNRKQVDAFIVQQWYTMQMVVHGERMDGISLKHEIELELIL